MKTLVDKVSHSKMLIESSLKEYAQTAVFVSFGKDSMVVLHLARRIDPLVKVVSVMTKFKPPETFQYKDEMKKKWNLNLQVYQSDVEVPIEMAFSNPDECCRILKVEPTKEAIKDLDAWITGLRRTEGRTRTDYLEVEPGLHPDTGKDIIKVNPILDWTETDIWKYMAVNSIPVHPWYAKGYRSLGCYPCTSLTDDKDTERAGRWNGTSKCGGECGIHTMFKK